MVNANITGAHPLCNHKGDGVLQLISLFFVLSRNVLRREEASPHIHQITRKLNLTRGFARKRYLSKYPYHREGYPQRIKITLNREIIFTANQIMEIDQLCNDCHKKSEPVIGSSLFKLPDLFCRSLFYESFTESYDGFCLAS